MKKRDLRFKHSAATVAEIRQRKEAGETLASIARELKIPLVTVKSIVYNRTRKV
jgi:hypothetical protein